MGRGVNSSVPTTPETWRDLHVAFHRTGVDHRARWYPMTPRPPVVYSHYSAMASQASWHVWQAPAHFLQQGMSPHFKHSAAQFSHAFAHSPHIAPDSGASYSIKATHARHVSRCHHLDLQGIAQTACDLVS